RRRTSCAPRGPAPARPAGRGDHPAEALRAADVRRDRQAALAQPEHGEDALLPRSDAPRRRAPGPSGGEDPVNAESSDERLLRQILEGEVDEHHAEVAQRLARSPALAARLAEMRAAAKALDALGEEARDVLGEVSEERDTSDLPGADRLEIVRARLSAETSRGRDRKSTRLNS